MSRTNTCRSAPAFTYVELLIVLAVVAILTAVILPVLVRMRETSRRQLCASQLSSIGQALLLYTNDNKGAYPRTVHAPGAVVIPTWGTGAAASNPFAPSGPAPNDVTAALFLLLRTQDITPEVFLCPSTAQQKWDFGGGQNTALNWSNWTDVKNHLSYSYQNPYVDEACFKRIFRGFRLSTPIFAEFAIASDMNPGCMTAPINVTTVTTTSSARDMKFANSRNHGGDGQNVLYGDGHVLFEQNPFVGTMRDNIFTTKLASTGFSGGPVVASPFDAADSILLPTSR